MTTLVDKIQDKNTKIGIDGLTGPISKRISNHNGAWAHMIMNQCINAGYTNIKILDKGEKFHDYDAIILYLGISYEGTLNLFGGLGDEFCKKMIQLESFPGKLLSLQHELPDLVEMVSKRLKNSSTSPLAQIIDLEEVQKAIDRTEKFDRVEKTSKLCFGDSHCFSMYQPGYMVNRNDGLTLFSILRDGLKNKIMEKSGIDTDDLTHLTFYAGNIDIRHHLCRREDYLKAIEVMALYLGEQLKSLNIPNIEIVHAIPIENESRKLPKTGYYKDTPFYGSWAKRTEVVKRFNRIVDMVCKQNGWKALRWPNKMLNENRELSFDAMEKPQSVHVSREFYRWDMENNCKNKVHKSEVLRF
ncbi:hypothetical protein CMI47_15900 [Candidatus Pacearchaeota archaeon]|nr:hypothetical protein [Candidatus Pacearchaeota archaeon]